MPTPCTCEEAGRAGFNDSGNELIRGYNNMIPPPYDTSLVDQQTAIRGWGVESWDVPWEMELVNDFDPEILTITHDSSNLKQQGLLERIKEGRID